MYTKRLVLVLFVASLLILSVSLIPTATAKPVDAVRLASSSRAHITADSPLSPTTPVKLIFIHHSTGGNWLADPNGEQYNGGLGRALMDNNYFVSATNYGWGPDEIGLNTDIGHWWDWFRGGNAITYTTALYTANGQNICNPTADPPYECFGIWPRMPVTPTGENEIVLFKGCFPNAHLSGTPTDPATTGDNPLRGQSAWVWDDGAGAEVPNPNHTVANAKGIYNDLLVYFTAHQDKLFIVITGPPLLPDDTDFATDAAHAANYRAFNEWLMNDWLTDYAYHNVAVFDYYNVLTSNAGDPDTNDAGLETGNHHRWWSGAVQYVSPVDYDLAAYGVSSDSHPTTAGQQKATAEFVQLLNVFYNRWKSGGAPCINITDVILSGPTSGYTNTAYPFAANATPSGASTPITYTWTPAPVSGQNTASASYSWAITGTQTLTLTAENCGARVTKSHTLTIVVRTISTQYVYLPIILRNYGTPPPACANPLTGVTISGASSGLTNTTYTFTAAPTPSGATTPITYTWTPVPNSGQGSPNAAYQWANTGDKTISVSASHCSAAHSATDEYTITIQSVPRGALVQPRDFTYLGAFRLPGDEAKPRTFEYGGNAMTFNPEGDVSGTLFIMGHDRQPYGGLPNGGQIAELRIPVPISTTTIATLNTAEFVQNFTDVFTGYFTNLEELPRTGMAYLNHASTGPQIHLSWGQHHQPDTATPSYAWFSSNLATPNVQGVWFIGTQDWYSLNGYMFEIPASWADAHTGGRYLGTGRQMDGGWGGMGPSLFAYRPWQIGGSPEVSGTHLAETPLLLYEDTQDNGDVVQGAHTLVNHQHPDEWEGGAWLTTTSGKSAVIFVGNKGTGAKYWYGYRNPAGTELPCVNTQAASEFTACRMADGSACPPADMVECAGHTSAKGWWCAEFTPRFILYDPSDLAQVAAGTMDSWEPQPYAHLDVGAHIFDNPAGVDLEMLGVGVQRRYLFGGATYDRAAARLYVLELFADEGKPVVHVWQIQ